MPANLPPQFYQLEREYREKKTIKEKIEVLKKMYAIMPKHKGTDKLQAEIKARISKLREELENEKKRGGKRNFIHIEKEGAGQIVLVGPPNTGKSTILSMLSNARPEIGDYPFTTKTPCVGMVPFEDIQLQMVDLPPIAEGSIPFWVVEIVRNSDLVLIVLSFDLNIEEEFKKLTELLREKKIEVVREPSEEGIFGMIKKKGIVFINKKDEAEDVDLVKSNLSLKVLSGSSFDEKDLDELKRVLFEELGIIRVYTKEPGKPPDFKDPIILKEGATVYDAAERLHKEIARKLKYARLWGSSKFDGQRVFKNQVLKDKDIVEFHTKK
ncbi:MAG: GTP-binding protein [Caldiserica bacterium]|nr:MAG: GTP-binding protein [Caldisericota bacterium]